MKAEHRLEWLRLVVIWLFAAGALPGMVVKFFSLIGQPAYDGTQVAFGLVATMCGTAVFSYGVVRLLQPFAEEGPMSLKLLAVLLLALPAVGLAFSVTTSDELVGNELRLLYLRGYTSAVLLCLAVVLTHQLCKKLYRDAPGLGAKQ